MLKPTWYCTSIFDVDLAVLAAHGVEALFVDLDNTLLPHHSKVITQRALEWGRAARSQGFSVTIVSNNWHDNVTDLARELELDLVAKSVKPLPFSFWRAMRHANVKAAQAVMVGDQIFTDIIGANLVGLRTILVEPLTPVDMPHTAVLRKIERRILSDMTPGPIPLPKGEAQ